MSSTSKSPSAVNNWIISNTKLKINELNITNLNLFILSVSTDSKKPNGANAIMFPKIFSTEILIF